MASSSAASRRRRSSRRAGRQLAERVVRKHRIIERLLTDFMGYTPSEAHVQADLLGDTFTDDMVERIVEAARQPRPLPARLAGRDRVEQAENAS